MRREEKVSSRQSPVGSRKKKCCGMRREEKSAVGRSQQAEANWQWAVSDTSGFRLPNSDFGLPT